MSPLKFLAYLIILCFEKRVAKENAIDRLKYFGTPKFLPQKMFGLATPLVHPLVAGLSGINPKKTSLSNTLSADFC